MQTIKPNKQLKITVIGSGIAGISTTYYLAKKEHEITIIDPTVNNKINEKYPQNATEASLGILMGYVFKRSKGRGWKMRSKSMEIWSEWMKELKHYNDQVMIQKPLIQLANSIEESEIMKTIANERRNLGLYFITSKNVADYSNKHGGLLSSNDGRIDPKILILSLKEAIKNYNIRIIKQSVLSIKRSQSEINTRWQVIMTNGQIIEQDIIVICAGLGTNDLLKSLGHKVNIEPILGQALELEVKNQTWSNWPAVLSINGINLIPKGKNKILIGASVEPGVKCGLEPKINMLNTYKKNLSKQHSYIIKNTWSGLRARPKNSPAPLLLHLEKGLIINSGHYRNGLLLAPSCAEWVDHEIQKEIN
tara:strand:- start:217 stop:1305 length:1089 start_codon:yes stop_codon:yes gene_type:complete